VLLVIVPMRALCQLLVVEMRVGGKYMYCSFGVHRMLLWSTAYYDVVRTTADARLVPIPRYLLSQCLHQQRLEVACQWPQLLKCRDITTFVNAIPEIGLKNL
jgi:hypothetical protein